FFKIEISGNLNSNIEVEYKSVDLNSNIKVEYRNIDLNSNIKVEYGSVDINSIIKIEYDNSNGLLDEEYNELLDLYKGQLFKTTKELLEVLIRATDRLCLYTILTDTNSAMSLALSTIMSLTQLLHCIWHISQNLQKNIKNKLEFDWDLFIKDFYKTYNILDLQTFENQFKNLLEYYLK
ncbi:36609_t:CDS:2, partial [Gigaspora margarita]